ncbi:pyroglutamyl-peptidase I [Dokdonella sp.]|uniref:pyroglutamyl-peptidase I n=1 Tax=Dokdonella sp. TaxID=2291710 RepID=UPI0027B97393|nr:pyroglutamyl-peptidase I [Dokdonella sp.]
MNDARPLLVTGFEPFGGDGANPAQDIVRALDGEWLGKRRIVTATLPVAFARVGPVIDALLAEHDPALVLALGLAAGRSELSFERGAINLVDARIADNDGAQPIDEAVLAHGPPAHFATLPLKAIVAALRAHGIPAGLSLSAGSYVCNQVFYLFAQRLAQRTPAVRCGFLHLPCLPAQAAQHAGQPSMALATMLEGVRLTLACALAVEHDLRASGGTLA